MSYPSIAAGTVIEIERLAAGGLTGAEIARRLNIPGSTARVYARGMRAERERLAAERKKAAGELDLAPDLAGEWTPEPERKLAAAVLVRACLDYAAGDVDAGAWLRTSEVAALMAAALKMDPDALLRPPDLSRLRRRR